MRCRGPGALTMFGRRATDHCDQAGACLPIRGRALARSCGAGLPLWPSLARIEGAAGPRQPRHHSKPWAAEGVRRQVSWWGFCTIRSLTTACRRRVAALMVQFPPFGGGVIGKQAAPGPARALWPFRRASHLWRWGFCSIRSLASACRRRVAALLVQFPPFVGALDVGRARPCASHSAIPPFAGGEATVRGGVAPKVQTTSAKTPTMGCHGRSGLRFGHNGARPGVSLAREPAIASANRLYRT